jgi:hypothetical protein
VANLVARKNLSPVSDKKNGQANEAPRQVIDQAQLSLLARDLPAHERGSFFNHYSRV